MLYCRINRQLQTRRAGCGRPHLELWFSQHLQYCKSQLPKAIRYLHRVDVRMYMQVQEVLYACVNIAQGSS
jgi:hypothetical protein